MSGNLLGSNGNHNGLVEHDRQDKLRQWKFPMKTGPKGIGNWLKTKNNPPVLHIKNSNGDVSDTLADGAQIVYDFWDQFWTYQKQNSRSDAQISDLICQGLPSGPNFMQRPPKDVEIWYKMTQSRGSHGCDGWKGNELRHLPLGAAKAFHAINQRWLRTGEVPKQMTQARMISLPKQGKAVDGILPVSQRRPITVFSVWWRIWCMSCLQTKGVTDLVQAKIPPNICARKGHSVQQVACHIIEQYCEQGYMLSLDWSKCFDTLAIGPTVNLMKTFGIDNTWCQLCHNVWSQQERFVSWNGTIHPYPLRTCQAIPQGDPWGPFVMMLWATSAFCHVERNLPHNCPSAETVIFMDDRTLISRNLEG